MYIFVFFAARSLILLSSISLVGQHSYCRSYHSRAFSNAKNVSAFDGPFLLSLLLSSSYPFRRRQGWILLTGTSQSRYYLAFEIYSLLHRMPSGSLHLIHRVLENLGSIGKSQ
ncbi:hypothetical protein TNCV_2731111 [Trichonephila clavipes]|nr:hypothetical protein TNCV_2731111 [Trichonephila clavipes]